MAKRSGIDFSQYKQNTIQRRIDKRMEALKLKGLPDYYQVIKQNPAELDRLFDTVLIGVTEFFRDKEPFEALRQQLAGALRQKRQGDSLRVWSVGCATGEEAYSLAILYHEILGEQLFNYQLQIFASDIDEKALGIARRGVYSTRKIANLESALVEKYFTKTANGYQVKKNIKQHILFSRHDLTNDPPFVKLDLIVCRNLLIYFNNHLQREALRIFNYSLKTDGLLFLGKSESTSVAKELFENLDGGKIFRKVKPRVPLSLGFSRYRFRQDEEPVTKEAKDMSLVEIAKETLYYSSEYPFVIINDFGEIKEAQGSLRLYIELSQGAMNANVLKMANRELAMEIRSLLVQAAKSGAVQTSSVIKFTLFDQDHFVRLKLLPLLYPSSGSQQYILQFEKIEPSTGYLQFAKEVPRNEFENYRIRELEQEVMTLREHLQTFTEELETNNEEMQAMNEELQSANEELKSANEELETSNEELQSSNEELHTANAEFRAANAQLIEKEEALQAAILESRKNEHIYKAISESIPNGTVGLLNSRFCIEYVAGQGLDVLNIKAADVIGLCLPDLNPSAEERKKLHSAFLDTLDGKSCSLEFSFQDHTYLLQTMRLKFEDSNEPRIMYLTQDITERKEQERNFRQSEARFRTLADNIPNLCWIAEPNGEIFWYNSRWYEYTGTTLADMQGWGWQSVHDPEVLPDVIERWKASLATGNWFEMTFPLKRYDGEFRPFLTRVFPLKDETGKVMQWFGTNTDITEQKQESEKLEALVRERTNELVALNKLLAENNAELNKSNDDLQQFAHVASHDLKEPVRKIKTFINILSEGYRDNLPERARNFVNKIIRTSDRMATMIDGMLAYSMLDSYSALHETVDLDEVLRQIYEDIDLLIAEKNAGITWNKLPVMEGSQVLLYQLFYNLLKNSLKFVREGVPPVIRIKAAPENRDGINCTRIEVHDNGIGFEPQFADSIFRTFSRLHSQDKFEGSGLGLALCRSIVQRHHGTITATGKPGEGSTFTVLLPLKQALPEG